MKRNGAIRKSFISLHFSGLQYTFVCYWIYPMRLLIKTDKNHETGEHHTQEDAGDDLSPQYDDVQL